MLFMAALHFSYRISLLRYPTEVGTCISFVLAVFLWCSYEKFILLTSFHYPYSGQYELYKTK